MLNTIYHSISPIALSLGSLQVRWYGLAYLAGFVVAGFLIWKTSKRWNIRLSEDDFLVIILSIMLGIIFGARLGYVLFYGGAYYLEHPLKILAVNEGGMSFHGGLIGLAIGGFVASKLTRISFATMADLFAIAAPAGLFFGRIANFINGELWGAPTTMPWGVVFDGAAGALARHPSQLYEALLEGLVLFIVLVVLSRKNPPLYRGMYAGIFLTLYGVFRFALEFVRQPDAHIGYLAFDWLTMGQVLSMPLIVAGVTLLVYANLKHTSQDA